MKVYTYSQARQRLSTLLDEARKDGEVRIKRRDGAEFVLSPVTSAGSPLDVEGVDLNWSRDEIVAAIREGRDR
jgi:antitoxin Phd